MSLFVVTLVFLIAISLAIHNRRIALLVAVFLAPWQGLDVDVGLRLTAYLVVLVTIFLVFVLQWLSSSRGVRIGSHAALPALIVTYAVIWSACQVPYLPDVDVQGGAFRTPAIRAVSQIFMFILTVSPILLVPWAIRSMQDYLSIARIYLISVVVLAAIGWLQLVIWWQTGSDPLPIGFVNSLLGGAGEERSGITTFYDEVIYRMSSFGGEPKGLATSLAVALLLLQLDRVIWRRQLIVWAFLFCSLLATLSTMGMVLWLVGTLAQLTAPLLFLTSRHPKVSRRIHWRGLLIAGLLISVPGIGLFSTERGGDLVELIGLRTVGRISEGAELETGLLRGAMEDFNVAVYDFLADRPEHTFFGVGLGNAHIYANLYLPDYAKPYAEGTTFVAKSTILRWISELGIFSLLAFLGWLFLQSRKLVLISGRNGFGSLAYGVIGRFFVPMILMWLASGYITPQFYLSVGVVTGLMYAVRTSYEHHASDSI